MEDAKWLGVPVEAAFSRAELRRRRDQLMAKHHPDHGGDVVTAVQVNETYKRMIEWLKRREKRATQARPEAASIRRKVRAAATAIGSAAIVVAAALAALRGARKP